MPQPVRFGYRRAAPPARKAAKAAPVTLDPLAVDRATIQRLALAAHDQGVVDAAVASIDWQGRDQAVADAAIKAYRRLRRAAKAQAVATPEPSEPAANAAPDLDLIEVAIAHRDRRGLITHVTKHRVASEAEAAELVDDA